LALLVLKDDVDMIWHDAPREQLAPSAVKLPQSIRRNVSYVRLTQKKVPRTLIKAILHVLEWPPLVVRLCF
jgi:hypothetical protein